MGKDSGTSVTVICLGENNQDSFDCRTFENNGKKYYVGCNSAKYAFDLDGYNPLTKPEMILRISESSNNYNNILFLHSEKPGVIITEIFCLEEVRSKIEPDLTEAEINRALADRISTIIPKNFSN